MKVSPKIRAPKKSLAFPLSHNPTEHKGEVVSQACPPIAKSIGPFSYRGGGGGISLFLR
jgi:hypothetical protein